MKARAGVGGGVVELGAHLVFDDAAFFFHHQHRAEAVGEGGDAGGLQRPDQADFVEPQAQLLGPGGVDAEAGEGALQV